MIDFNEYQNKCKRTWRHDGSDRHQLMNCALGLGESGEVQNLVKKHVFQGHNLDTWQIIDELGDILFYVAMTAEVLGVPLNEIAGRNVDKLAKRYPNGFEEERSKNRQE